MVQNTNLEETQGVKSGNKKIKISNRLSNIFLGADTIKNLDYKSTDYLLDKLIPRGTLCALVGESDTGKSSFLRQLAVSIVYGDRNFLGFELNSSCRNVLYVSTEDSKEATSAWLNKYFGEEMANDAKLSKLKYVYDTDGLIKNIKEIVRQNCVDLIIIDSYADLFNGSMNNANEVRAFLNTYNQVANKYGVTIVFLHHTKKGTSGLIPNKDNILGSQGFEAKMRSVLMLVNDENDSSLRHLCIIKNNYLSKKEKERSYVLKFNEHLTFEDTGERVLLNDLGSEPWFDDAKQMREQGLSYR